MKKSIIFTAMGIWVASTMSLAAAAPLCQKVVSQLDEVFSDTRHKIPKEDQAPLALLKRCADQHSYCVIVTSFGSDEVRSIGGNKMSAIDGQIGSKERAVMSLGSIGGTVKNGRCVLARFSGGTSSTWTIDAWEVKSSVVRELNSDGAELHGEVKGAKELLVDAERIARKLK